MSFEPKLRAYTAPVFTVEVGSGERKMTLGGESVQPLCFFDKPDQPVPLIGVEVSDIGFETEGLPELAAFYAGADTLAARAVKAASLPGASFVCLHFEGADPAATNKSVEDCVAEAKEAVAACPLPVVIAGCKNIEKDTALFTALAEALTGENLLFLSAREEDYKAMGAAVALAYGHKLGAESAVDINLAKQLNVVLTQLGVASSSVVMNLGAAAAGYGFEYVASTLDRVRSAALEQQDGMLRMPVVTIVSAEAWSVKEAIVSEADMPEWGPREERGIHMEAVTAAACLASGSDAVILRHPVSVEKTAALIAALM